MIVLFTDFGTQDAYVGQMHGVLAQAAPDTVVIDLMHHVPNFDVRAGAYLLPAYVRDFPPDAIFVCVVDPGVGGEREPVIVRAFQRWFIGPDNGLFELLIRRDDQHEVYRLEWRPDRLSASFHGRDLFAPAAALLVRGELPMTRSTLLHDVAGRAWPDDLAQIIYLDHFGNAVTGLRAGGVNKSAGLEINGHKLTRARTFSDVASGKAFWYENANGLIEIAVNQGSAQLQLSIVTGDPVKVCA